MTNAHDSSGGSKAESTEWEKPALVLMSTAGRAENGGQPTYINDGQSTYVS